MNLKYMNKRVALLGNSKGVVKPWYLPFDFVFCRIIDFYEKKGKASIIRNSSVKNIAHCAVEIEDGKVIGLFV